MTVRNPRSRRPYVYAWLLLAITVGAIIYAFHLI